MSLEHVGSKGGVNLESSKAPWRCLVTVTSDYFAAFRRPIGQASKAVSQMGSVRPEASNAGVPHEGFAR
jgi:hypothetical protein